MVGTKGHSGGARAGAGRKTDTIRELQQTNRRALMAEVTEADLRTAARALINKANSGDEKAFRALFSYLLGNPESELTLKGDADAPLRVEVVYLDETGTAGGPASHPPHSYIALT